MKFYVRLFLIVISLILVSVFIYWQFNKKSIVNKAVANVVERSAGGIYKIDYDSSKIDELNGNASFFNITLKADSLISVTGVIPSVLFDVKVKELSIRGTNIAGILTGTRLETKTIEIIDPVIKIVGTNNKPLNRADSLELYERILGDLKLIKADEIIVTNGNVSVSEKYGVAHTALTGVDVSVKDFRIDSTTGYENVIAYFVKDAVVNVDTTVFRSNSGKSLFTQVKYDAARQLVTVDKFIQQDIKASVVTEMRALSISGLSTNSFIYLQKLQAKELTSAGGKITVYNRKQGKKQVIELDSSFFDRASLEKIHIGKTRVTIYSRDQPERAPTIINNVTFVATDIPVITSGSTTKNIITRSKWVVTGDGLSYLSDDGLYRNTIGPFIMDKGQGKVSASRFTMSCVLTEQKFIQTRKVQQDLYEMVIKDIVLTGADVGLLIEEGVVQADVLSLQPSMKIYSNRTLPSNPADKTGKFPNQRLLAQDNEFTVKQINIQNGYLSYRETGALSGQTGQIFFENIRGTIRHVSNVPASIQAAPICIATINADFMGVSKLNTRFTFPLNVADGSFSVEGKLGSIQGSVLNAALEPQGMASVKRGTINSFVFNIKGNVAGADIRSTLLYKDLKVDILEKEADKNDLDKKNLISFLANIFIKDKNPDNGKVRSVQHYEVREKSRSFFGLIWKSMFASIKKTITGKTPVK